MVIIQVCVDLGRTDIGMPQQFQDDPNMAPDTSKWVAKECLSMCGVEKYHLLMKYRFKARALRKFFFAF